MFTAMWMPPATTPPATPAAVAALGWPVSARMTAAMTDNRPVMARCDRKPSRGRSRECPVPGRGSAAYLVGPQVLPDQPHARGQVAGGAQAVRELLPAGGHILAARAELRCSTTRITVFELAT